MRGTGVFDEEGEGRIGKCSIGCLQIAAAVAEMRELAKNSKR
jgi:hypothetical protein